MEPSRRAPGAAPQPAPRSPLRSADRSSPPPPAPARPGPAPEIGPIKLSWPEKAPFSPAHPPPHKLDVTPVITQATISAWNCSPGPFPTSGRRVSARTRRPESPAPAPGVWAPPPRSSPRPRCSEGTKLQRCSPAQGTPWPRFYFFGFCFAVLRWYGPLTPPALYQATRQLRKQSLCLRVTIADTSPGRKWLRSEAAFQERTADGASRAPALPRLD